MPMTHNSSSAVQLLDINTLPLTGVRLIEASAGTGKTYTISSIYVRLILGHECTALTPENILVVTFTRAATEELRDRIRKRLKQVLTDFQTGKSDDTFVTMLLQETADREGAISRLKDAIQLMDLAAIYTIHSFAQRLLRQHGVEANVAGEFELVLDEGDILLQAAQDVWRANVYPLNGATLELVLSQWKTPTDILKDSRSLLYKDVAFHLGEAAQDLSSAQEKYQSTFDQLKELWLKEGEGFVKSIEEHPQAHGNFKRYLNGYKKRVDKFLNGESIVTKELKTALAKLSPQGMTGSVKKGGEPIEHRISGAAQNLLDYLDPYEKAKAYELRRWRVSFVEQIKARVQLLKQQKQLMATDDLLIRLNQALQRHGEDVLLNPVREQFPVAMVDEFQDTDDTQYNVFRTLYVPSNEQVTERNKDLALFMIGDPKQAIYKFRGADIFTYIQAKQEVEQSYSLDTNYRSTANLVEGVNQIFTRHNQSFIYDDSIPFVPVKAKDVAKPLLVDGKQQSAIIWRYVNGEQQEIKNKGGFTSAFSEDCAEHITQLLNAAHHSRATIGEQPVCAKDIAVLVRNRHQAQIVKQALTQRGVGCVYVGQESVFDSDEATALLMLLHAVHSMGEKPFRNALAHPIWMQSLSTLGRHMQDEQLWETQLEQLYTCHEIWSRQGIMPMLMYWLHSQSLPAKWLAQSHGERLLTNMLHLGELLQQASVELQGMQGLLSWFDKQVTSALVGEAEQKQLRLESDANLVQIVTIHKSKGLEYPIVYLPFLWDGKESKDEVFYDLESKTLRCDLVGDYKDQRIQEGLAEEIRLLYVALTRAASQCYVSMPELPAKGKIRTDILSSALWYVLYHKQEADVLSSLKDMTASHSSVFNLENIDDAVTSLLQDETAEQLQAKSFEGSIARDWQLSSFSSLVRHHHAPHTARFNLDDDQQADTNSGVQVEEENIEEQKNGFTFPKGAHAGNFLHTLLEEVDFTEPVDQMGEVDELIQSLLERFGIETIWLDTVKEWLSSILSTPLQHDGLSLSALDDAAKQVEMEFYFPIERLSAKDFNGVLNQYSVLSCDVSDVEFKTIKGMLKGFIDLTFVWQDQYFVLDYKSNHLGMDFSDYQQPALEQAMSDHRYDIQLVLYTLALHRLLKLRINNYSYDEHIGGGYYLFLRGMNIQGNEGQFFHKPERRLIDALDQLIDGEKGDGNEVSNSKLDSVDENMNQMDLLG
jgi:exodeoxyribonuclease V beta subunit